MILLQSARSGWNLDMYVTALLFLFVIGFILRSLVKRKLQKQFVSHWHHYIEKMEMTPTEFYDKITDVIGTREVQNVKVKREWYEKTSGWFSGKRMYLEISNKGYFFIVGAYPYGNGFFVSYWQMENRSSNEAMLRAVPLIGNWLANMAYDETFFTYDTRMMYQKMIHSCILAAVEEECATKGLRSLTETERTAQVEPFYKR